MQKQLKPRICHPSGGRVYKLGAADSIEVKFQADGDEVENRYAITEWWMEPGAPELTPHVHEANDELIYVLDGTATILIGEKSITLERGGLVVIPSGTVHAFQNDSEQRMGILNIFLNGAYEAMMPQITAMFAGR